jgi:3-methyl-2-oxobutanoate hydroxymethyltransferase
MMTFDPAKIEKITIRTLKKFKKAGIKLTVLTAYDYPTALILDRVGVEVVLVGDTLNTVFCGRENNLSATLDQMIYHASIVKRGTRRALLVGDMPFMSFQADPGEAVRNAGRFLSEAGTNCVKVEGGLEILPTIERIINAGIPVMGHLGLTPQSVHRFGGYIVRGRKPEVRQYLLESARALEETGCFALVLESIPADLGMEITGTVEIPTIGIGAGPHCDGQVLVIYDLLGLTDGFKPKFLRKYENFAERMEKAVSRFMQDVRSGDFPSGEESYD